MDGALVVVLVLAWALLLLPSALRSRRSSPQATVGGFEEAMAVLRNRPQGREVMVPGDAARIVGSEDDLGPDPGGAPGIGTFDEHHWSGEEPTPTRIDPVLARRRRTLGRLAITAGANLLLALVVGGFLWTLAVVALAGLGGYLALLRRWKLQREQAREVVRMLQTSERRHEEQTPELVPQAVGEVPGTLGGWDGELQVATAPDEPWRQGAGVRIRRWEG